MDTADRDARPGPPGDAAVRPASTTTATPTATGDGSIRGGSRRGALHAAGVAVLAALGLQGGAARQNRATSEQHRNPDGHDHGKQGKRGKRGKRGEVSPGGAAGGPGSAGAKGDKGDQGPGKTMLSATTSWDPGLLFSGLSSHTRVEVPGAAVGDPVMAGFTSIPFPPFASSPPYPIYGHVIDAGFVDFILTNLSNTSESFANGTLTVVVIKP